ncbi:hypothetical protein, partial [Bizionia gelidisalsuginis]|uniref:hypothetical protein n=1 Tax=Bizionia gelidisalsuginis TaxID=291188 RepID=UPI0014790EE9
VVARCTSVGASSVFEVVLGATVTVEAKAVNSPSEKRAIKVIFRDFISMYAVFRVNNLINYTKQIQIRSSDKTALQWK